MAAGPHRFTWDLDKTYLRTEFETIRGLLRAAFEPAEEKQAYPGASTLLRALKRRPGHRLHILSGSPRQMRRALERKLALDGIMWDRFKLKPNLENVLRGRFHDVREQVGYKLAALLRWRARDPEPVSETLVGDDSEADAFVYSLYADLVAGWVGSRELGEVLTLTEYHPETRARIDDALGRVVLREAVGRVLIHLDRRTPPEALRAFGPRCVPVSNYFQVALVLHADGRVADRDVVDVAREMAGAAGYGTAALVHALVDLVRRGHLAPDAARRIGTVMADALGGRPWRGLPAALAEAGRGRRPAPAAGAGARRVDYAALYRSTGGRPG